MWILAFSLPAAAAAYEFRLSGFDGAGFQNAIAADPFDERRRYLDSGQQGYQQPAANGSRLNCVLPKDVRQGVRSSGRGWAGWRLSALRRRRQELVGPISRAAIFRLGISTSRLMATV